MQLHLPMRSAAEVGERDASKQDQLRRFLGCWTTGEVGGIHAQLELELLPLSDALRGEELSVRVT